MHLPHRDRTDADRDDRHQRHPGPRQDRPYDRAAAHPTLAKGFRNENTFMAISFGEIPDHAWSGTDGVVEPVEHALMKQQQGPSWQCSPAPSASVNFR